MNPQSQSMDKAPFHESNSNIHFFSNSCTSKSRLKSIYFLKYLFSYVTEKKKLELLKYNKNIQKQIELSIIDYKKYSGEKTQIQLEIILLHEKTKFINIKNNEQKYCYTDANSNRIKIVLDYQVQTFEGLFSGCDHIKSIKFIKFYRTNITSMENMFNGCSSLKKISFLNFKTENVKKMNCMFHCCSKLQKINLSKFNTENVIDMSGMFAGCLNLKKIIVSGFNTKNVTNMSAMFSGCSSLKNINISNFDTSNVIDMNGIFANCFLLKKLDMSNFNFDNLMSMRNMFWGCKSLKKLDISIFNTDKTIDVCGMFFKCPIELTTKIKSQYKNIGEEAFKDEDLTSI